MAGKNTGKTLHKSRLGGWALRKSLSAQDAEILSGILNRSLTSSECDQIARLINIVQTIKDADNNRPGHQSLIETLTGMANADDAHVLAAMENCDDTSECLIEESLHGDMRVAVSPEYPPALIRGAAWNALFNLGQGKDGRELGYRNYFADAVIRLWSELGHPNTKISKTPGKETPIVCFAWQLLDIIEPDTCPKIASVSDLLRKVSR